MRAFFLFAGWCACAAFTAAHAMVFYNLDNDAHTTDPETGVPFGNVATVYNAGGTPVGSAVYLDNGYFITANHVSVGEGYTYSFDGATYYGIDVDLYAPTRVDANTDLKIFYSGARVLDGLGGVDIMASALNLTFLKLFTGEYPTVTLVGGGVGRAADSELATGSVSWGGYATCDIRWGENKLRYYQDVSNGAITYKAYLAVNDDAAQANSCGDGEAALTLCDSGGGVFYWDETARHWYLIAIATGVSDNASVSCYTTSGSAEASDCLNMLEDLSPWAQTISAMIAARPIPEGGATAALLGLAGLACAACRRGAGRK